MYTHAISGGHQLTVDTADLILRNGGNAIDAAIAAYWMAMVAEPFMANAAAGGFAMIRDDQQVLHAMDFFCQTPIQKRPLDHSQIFPITVDFGTTTENFYVGMGSVAIPGAVAALYELHDRWATIPMKDLVKPAVEASKQGIALDSFQTYECQLLKSIFELDPVGKSIFLTKDDQLKKEHDLIKYEHFGDFAETMAIEGRDLFYQGEIGQSISHMCHEQGGHLTMDDFEAYKVIVTKPFHYAWNGYNVHSIPYPSVGAMIQAAMLTGLSSATDVIAKSQNHLGQLQRITKQVYDIKGDLNQLKSYLKSQGITVQTPDHKAHKWGGTSHFNIIDKDGMAISLSTSIGEGNGVFIPGTDMQLNNMLGELALLPNGIHSWEENVRLQSMMCPTMITDEDHQLKMLVGSGGAGRIPFAMSQTIFSHLGLGATIEESIHMPRLIYDGSHYHIEEGFDMSNFKFDHKRWNTASLFFGGTHAISLEGERKIALGDHRRYGRSKSMN